MAATSASWLDIPRNSHFSLANVPFGIISTAIKVTPVPAVALGTFALDLEAFTRNQGFSGLPSIQSHLHVFSEPTLNAFAALGRKAHKEVRQYIQAVFNRDTQFGSVLRDNDGLRKEALIPLSEVQNHLPMSIGDYTDFFAGVNHATTMGKILRPGQNPLQPNFLHIPVAYHSRASSVVVSKTPFRRPRGQILLNPAAEAKVPTLAPTRRLDIELELGVFLCKENKLGEPVNVESAEDAIFGAVLLNDWSARDIQAWEYVPLGPFNAKNFASHISPWVILADALESVLTPSLQREREVLPYLTEERENNVWDIQLQVDITRKSCVFPPKLSYNFLFQRFP